MSLWQRRARRPPPFHALWVGHRPMSNCLESSWWHRHLAGAVHRLEACATSDHDLFMSYGCGPKAQARLLLGKVVRDQGKMSGGFAHHPHLLKGLSLPRGGRRECGIKKARQVLPAPAPGRSLVYPGPGANYRLSGFPAFFPGPAADWFWLPGKRWP
jgi:hypothetical protein